jgi:hypothetical protein
MVFPPPPPPPQPQPLPSLTQSILPPQPHQNTLPSYPSILHLPSPFFPASQPLYSQIIQLPNSNINPQTTLPQNPPNRFLPPKTKHIQQIPTNQYIPVSETGGNVFCIDSKAFKLNFDGGRMDPYNITERKGRYRGSLWVSNLGLRWLLDVFVKLRNPNQNTEGFFEFQRDGNKMLEISCHANRGGRFVEVSEYHSGNQQGCIRVPEGRRGAGWSVFEFQSRKYFLCETRHTPATQAFPRQTHDTGMTAGGTRNTNQDPRRQKRKSRKSRSTKSSGISGSSRDSRALGQSIAPITPTDVWRKKCLDSNLKSWVLMNPEAPRPTRKTSFNWNPSAKSLRVTKNEGEPRKAQWASLKFKAVGLAPPNVGPQAQPERINTSDPAPMDSDLHTSRVNASNVEAEASRLSDFQRESSDEAPGRSLGDSELSSVPPVNFEVTVGWRNREPSRTLLWLGWI